MSSETTRTNAPKTADDVIKQDVDENPRCYRFVPLFYGKDYKFELGTNLIRYDKGGNTAVKLIARFIALELLVINITMALRLSPLYNLVAYVSNWMMLTSLPLVLLTIHNELVDNINEKKSRLAWNHFLFELSANITAMGTIIYWIFIHDKVLIHYGHDFWMLLHMYLLHSFPAIALIIVYCTTDRIIDNCVPLTLQDESHFLFLGKLSSHLF